MIAFTVQDRAAVALEEFLLLAERKMVWTDLGVTDSDVLDVIDNWTVAQCEDTCTSDDCCDHQRLGVLVWAAVEERCV